MRSTNARLRPPLNKLSFGAIQNAALRLLVSINRSHKLVRHAIDIGMTAKEDIEQSLLGMDTLRGAIVLLHAGLEEFVRAIGRELLPDAGEHSLDNIPLASDTPQLHAGKYQLGSLARHLDKTVRDLVRESVKLYLSRRTFNSASEICAFLEDCGVDASAFRAYVDDIDALTKRRHSIVHQCDMEPCDGTAAARFAAWPAGSLQRTARWPCAVRLFSLNVLLALAPDAGKAAIQHEISQSVQQMREAENSAKSLLHGYATGEYQVGHMQRMLGICPPGPQGQRKKAT